jgi:hypothetical protein
MSYNITSNTFYFVLSFQKEIQNHLENPNLERLANQFAMMGVGKVFHDDGSLTFPQSERDLEYNEVVHHLLKSNNLLAELRGFFEYDRRLGEDSPLKMLTKGADQDKVEFLVENPDPRYFTP